MPSWLQPQLAGARRAYGIAPRGENPMRAFVESMEAQIGQIKGGAKPPAADEEAAGSGKPAAAGKNAKERRAERRKATREAKAPQAAVRKQIFPGRCDWDSKPGGCCWNSIQLSFSVCSE